MCPYAFILCDVNLLPSILLYRVQMRQFGVLIATTASRIFELMKHISILVPKKAILGSLEGSRQLFTQVNQFLLAKDEPAPFKVQLVGLSKETPLSGGCFTANTDTLLADVKKTD